MTKLQVEKLRTFASEAAAHRDASKLIVAGLRQSCLKDKITASDGELFVIAEAAIARQQAQAQVISSALLPRTKTDRRVRERRQKVRRKVVRRAEGLEALVEKFKRLGQPSRRKADRRTDADRREMLRRKHVRRTENR